MNNIHACFFCLFFRICGALRDLVPLEQFKKREKNPRRRLQPATLLQLTLLHGCLSHFLNCAHGTESRNAPHMSYYFWMIMWMKNLNNYQITKVQPQGVA